MKRFFLPSLCLSVVLTGAGCTSLVATDKASTDIAMTEGTKMTLEKTTAGLHNPLAHGNTTEVTVTTWNETHAGITWERNDKQETEASKKAREDALTAAVGSGIEVPEVQYEDVVRSGSVAVDDMLHGTHLALPSLWEEGAIDKAGEGNSLIWLSNDEYTDLVNTRHAVVTIGELDSLIARLLTYYHQAEALLAKVQGEESSTLAPTDISALTTLTADEDWGSYTFTYNDQKIKVQTVVARNAFAQFEILANPQNPLVLSVVPRPASWVMVALETLHADLALEGYVIKTITRSHDE